MKQLVILTILILLAGAGYVIFSVMMFQPDSVRPISFEDPLATAQIEEEELAPTLTSPELKARKDAAVKMILKTIKSYEDVGSKLPQSAQSTNDLFMQLVKRGALPALYPLEYADSSKPVGFAPFKITPEAVGSTTQARTATNVPVAGQVTNCTASTSIFSGGIDSDIMVCPPANNGLTRMILSGPGNDAIKTGGSVTIIDSGVGDDTIQSGSDLTMIFFKTLEGKKTINMDCQTASMQGKRLSPDYPLSWVYPYRHFIVFGPQVIEDNLIIRGNVIKDPVTNGEITMNGNCFNLVYASGRY